MGRAVRILRAVFHDMHMPEMAMKNAGEQGDKEKEFNPMRSIAVAGGGAFFPASASVSGADLSVMNTWGRILSALSGYPFWAPYPDCGP